LRVLDVSTLYAAPTLAALLADFGADVVKVETPEGDPLRTTGEQRDHHSMAWALAGRGKRAVTIDLARTAGIDLLARLLAAADVVVLNQPPHILERWKCTPEQIAEDNPRAIVVMVSAYGRSGPYALRAGAGSLGEAFGGLTHMTGEADGPPVLPSAPLGDGLAALAGMAGVLAACWWRDARGGTGQVVDVSFYEPIVSLLGTVVSGWDPNGPSPHRTGSRVPGGVPRNTYRTADDEWVVLSGPADAQVARVLDVLGVEEEEVRSRYTTIGPRLAHYEELDQLVASWIRARPRADVLAAFEAARIPITPVNDLAALAADPQVQARGSLVEVDDPDVGPIVMPAPVPKFSRTPGGIRWPGPPLGAHNHTVFGDWLGVGPDELSRWEAEGIV
jgi:crotonobetainyl-CoA:carnitine CoA-transferase CaiB-like acyl-CoA transferase